MNFPLFFVGGGFLVCICISNIYSYYKQINAKLFGDIIIENLFHHFPKLKKINIFVIRSSVIKSSENVDFKFDIFGLYKIIQKRLIWVSIKPILLIDHSISLFCRCFILNSNDWSLILEFVAKKMPNLNIFEIWFGHKNTNVCFQTYASDCTLKLLRNMLIWIKNISNVECPQLKSTLLFMTDFRILQDDVALNHRSLHV